MPKRKGKGRDESQNERADGDAVGENADPAATSTDAERAVSFPRCLAPA